MRRLSLTVLVALALAAGVLPAGAAPDIEHALAPHGEDALAPVEECLLIDTDDEPVRTGSCPGVRPGARVSTDLGGCSFNFVFTATDPTDDEAEFPTLIGTAGHCLEFDGDVATWDFGDPDAPAARAGGQEIGRFVYAALGGGRDFALIALHDDVEYDPQMCHYGGPTGIDPGPRPGSGFVEHSGQGVALGSTIPGRTHFVQTFNDPNSVRFYGAAIFGDSGSGIITADEGHAVGVVVSLGVATSGPVRAVRLTTELEEASRALGLDFEVMTAERL